ncbi:hypothetical protein [Rhodococcus kronopolitis]|uniref:Uncharacterized protein n=1 Tax=Rhodococcus kronopolitis TaxID=1460226 RepID=A0ABV9FJK1_9NOCA
MAAVTGDHGELMLELRELALAVLDRLEPMIEPLLERAAATAAEPAASEPGGPHGEQSPATKEFGCAWCPVCALAALARGEQHDLLTLLASQAAALLALIRALLEQYGPGPGPAPEGGPAEAPGDDLPRPGPRGFVPIVVHVEDNP